MKAISLFVVILSMSGTIQCQVWISKNVNIRFFSKTPMENVEGISKTAAAAINDKTGKIIVKVAMTSFKFDKALMQEHFNENYMESEKFPLGEFDGQIIDPLDYSKQGDYNVKVKGMLTMHGVKKEKEISANLKIVDGKIIVKSVFKAKCSEYNIEIPSLVSGYIQDELEVTVNAELLPKK